MRKLTVKNNALPEVFLSNLFLRRLEVNCPISKSTGSNVIWPSLILLIMGMLFASLPAVAQTPPATGTPAFGSFDGGPDIINLGNLNAHLSVPVFHKPGRGTNFTYDLSYDSSVWYKVTSGSTASWQPVNLFGWRGQTEVALGYVTRSLTTIRCPAGSGIGVIRQYSNYAFHDTFGITHPFNGTASDDCSGSGTYLGFTSVATDGSGYTLSVDSNALATVISSAGKLTNPVAYANAGNATATDRNGNQINVDTTGHFYDTLNGTTPVLTVAGSGNPTSPLTFTYTAPSGASATYTMKYAAYTVQTNFACGGISEYGPTVNNLVSEIDLPDGSKYAFTYEPTAGVSGAVTARLASVTLPTGGTITYNYPVYASPTRNNIWCPDGSTQAVTRTTPDGSWTYTRSGSAPASTTTITDPQGNSTVIQFQGIYETQRQVYQGSSTLLQTTNTCYNGAASPCVGTAVTQSITQRTVATILPNNQQSQHVESYNSYGPPTEVDDYDFGSGAPGALLRKTTITYASLSNINAFRQTTTVYNGAGTQIAQTTNNYDETAPTATSGLPQHVAVSGSRGNLTSVSQWVNTTNTNLTSHMTYYDTGAVNAATAANGAVTTYNYPDTASTCADAFPKSISEPMSMSRSFTWNCTGGVLTSVTDEDSQTTATTYNDPYFWRPASQNFPDGGQTSLTYNSPTSITTAAKMNASQNMVSTTLLDGLGRTRQTQLGDPQGTDYTDTAYDALGRLASVSNPYRSTSDPTYGITSYQYDALGRPTLVIPPDGSSTANNISLSYSGANITVTDQAGKKRSSTVDGLGHLIQVTEDPGGLGYLTTYGYDALDNLVSVVQNGSHQRSYGYDSLSRLTGETTPEAGTITYSYDASGYPGDLTSKTAPAPNQTGSATVTTTYSYDLLDRLTRKTYSDGTTPSPYYWYDKSTVWNYAVTNGVGRQVFGGIDNIGATISSFDSMGRVQKQVQCTPLNCGTMNERDYAYDLAGNNTSYKDVNPSNLGAVTYTQTFDTAGRLLQLTSSLNDAQHPATLFSVDPNHGYFPHGAIRTATFGNGLTQTGAYNNVLEPCRVETNTSASYFTQCTDTVPSGNVLDFTYGYNKGATNNGNVSSWSAVGQQIFTRTYSYDSLNRLSTMADSASGQPCKGLQWTYDAWGNRTDQSVTAGACGTFHASVGVNNRLSSPYQYDAAGNLINDGSHTYTYDAENRVIKVDGGSTATYQYDAYGRRVHRAVGTIAFDYIYDAQGRIIGEIDAANSWNRAYIYTAAQLIAEYLNGTTEFIHADHLGSTRLLTGVSQPASPLDNLDYLPFGEQIAGGTGTAHKFTGDERDSESNLDHTLFRQYSSQLGRWASPDPAGLAAVDPANPQSWNRYAYVANDPLDFVDPSGLFLIGPCGTDGSLCGGGGGGFGGDPCFFFWFLCGGGLPQPIGPSGGAGGGGRNPCAGSTADTCVSVSADPLPPPSASSRIQCATQFGRNHSLAAGVGAVFGDKVGNNFFTQLFLGNTVSSLAKIGTDVFDGTTPTGTQIASMALKGAGQGIPNLPGGFPVRGVTGTVRAAGIQAAVAVGYNTIAGVGQETLELGVSVSKVATVATPLASTTLQGIASGVAIAKFGFDALTFTYGAVLACHQ
jgi:RHS repeat-associated protein